MRPTIGTVINNNADKQYTAKIKQKVPLSPARAAALAKHGFKKGVCPNPNGRPKGLRSIRSILEEYGALEAPAEFIAKIREKFPSAKYKRLTLHDAVYLRCFMAAMSGENWAMQFIAERTEGKVPQKLDIKEETIIEVGFEEPESEPELESEPEPATVIEPEQGTADENN